MRMDMSKVTHEYAAVEAQRKERERRHKNYVASATMSYTSVGFETQTDDGETEDVEEPTIDASSSQYFSAIRTRAAQSHETNSMQRGISKRSIGIQTENDSFPQVSTCLVTKKGNVSYQLNPRLLAAGSLMMGVAGVSTRQAIMCMKIASNILFHQNYVLPPSLEKEYQKKMKLRKRLAKMGITKQPETTSLNIETTRQAVADIILEAEEVDDDNLLQQTSSDSNQDEINELIDVEERSISEVGKRELLARMLCKPTTLRSTHHLISTLGEQEQALEMIETQNVNLIPDGTARQGGWGKMAGAILKIGEKYVCCCFFSISTT